MDESIVEQDTQRVSEHRAVFSDGWGVGGDGMASSDRGKAFVPAVGELVLDVGERASRRCEVRGPAIERSSVMVRSRPPTSIKGLAEDLGVVGSGEGEFASMPARSPARGMRRW